MQLKFCGLMPEQRRAIQAAVDQVISTFPEDEGDAIAQFIDFMRDDKASYREGFKKHQNYKRIAELKRHCDTHFYCVTDKLEVMPINAGEDTAAEKIMACELLYVLFYTSEIFTRHKSLGNKEPGKMDQKPYYDDEVKNWSCRRHSKAIS